MRARTAAEARAARAHDGRARQTARLGASHGARPAKGAPTLSHSPTTLPQGPKVLVRDPHDVMLRYQKTTKSFTREVHRADARRGRALVHVPSAHAPGIRHARSDCLRRRRVRRGGARLLSRAAEAERIDAVMAFDCLPTLLAAAVNEELGLPGPSFRSVFVCCNKYYMRRELSPELLLATPPDDQLPRGPQDIGHAILRWHAHLPR